MIFLRSFPGGSDGKESSCSAGDQVWSPDWEDPLEKGIAIHTSILAWRIPWTENPGDLQSMALQRVRHKWLTHTHKRTHTHTSSRQFVLYIMSLVTVIIFNLGVLYFWCPSSLYIHKMISYLFACGYSFVLASFLSHASKYQSNGWLNISVTTFENRYKEVWFKLLVC